MTPLISDVHQKSNKDKHENIGQKKQKPREAFITSFAEYV